MFDVGADDFFHVYSSSVGICQGEDGIFRQRRRFPRDFDWLFSLDFAIQQPCLGQIEGSEVLIECQVVAGDFESDDAGAHSEWWDCDVVFSVNAVGRFLFTSQNKFANLPVVDFQRKGEWRGVGLLLRGDLAFDRILWVRGILRECSHHCCCEYERAYAFHVVFLVDV